MSRPSHRDGLAPGEREATKRVLSLRQARAPPACVTLGAITENPCCVAAGGECFLLQRTSLLLLGHALAAIPEREEQDVNAALKTYAVGLLWAFGFEAIHRAVPIVCKDMSWWKGLPDSQAKYEARAVSRSKSRVRRSTGWDMQPC